MGLGYIGLPTAALLANRNYQVHGVDVVQSTVDTINQGNIHIVEPNIKSSDEFDLVKDEEAINDSDIIVFLVAHGEFKGIRIFGKEVFDFCGVTNDNSMI